MMDTGPKLKIIRKAFIIRYHFLCLQICSQRLIRLTKYRHNRISNCFNNNTILFGPYLMQNLKVMNNPAYCLIVPFLVIHSGGVKQISKHQRQITNR